MRPVRLPLVLEGPDLDGERLGRKRVIFLTHSLEGGGAERVICNLANNLSGNYDLALMLLDDFDLVPEGVDVTFLNRQRLKFESDRGLAVNPIRMLQMTLSLRRELRRSGADVVVSFLEVPNILNVINRGRHQRIISVRNHMSGKGKGLVGRAAVSFSTRLADFTIAVSEMCRRDLIENFSADPERVRVLPNPLDIDRIIELMKYPGDRAMNGHDGSRILNVARLSGAKGHERLIDAFLKVKAELPDVRLFLVGDGDRKYDIIRKAEELGISDDVVLLGHQANPYPSLASADVFVLSSIYEGLPNSILEAMASGVPVVSTDCLSGPREILSPGTDPSKVADGIEHAEYGILLPPWSDDRYDGEDLMAKAIIELLKDDYLRESYSQRGLQRAMDFSVTVVIPQWDEFLEGLISKRD